jgi:regulator of sirC expression with transglutaminase-like and TPR domain
MGLSSQAMCHANLRAHVGPSSKRIMTTGGRHDPQNLLIRMSDKHHAQMMGCAGHPLAKISNLDAPAVRGTRLVDA